MNANLMNIHDALLLLTLDSIGMCYLTATHHRLTEWSGMASWVPRARCCHPPERHPQADFYGSLNTVMGPSKKRREMSVQATGMAEDM